MPRVKRPTRNSPEACRQEFERLKRRLQQIGYICLGSIVQRRIPCGKEECGCKTDSAKRHGPYYQWTRKVGGRTQTRMLPESLVKLYQEGIRNHDQMDKILHRMREVSLLAFEAAKIQEKA